MENNNLSEFEMVSNRIKKIQEKKESNDVNKEYKGTNKKIEYKKVYFFIAFSIIIRTVTLNFLWNYISSDIFLCDKYHLDILSASIIIIALEVFHFFSLKKK